MMHVTHTAKGNVPKTRHLASTHGEGEAPVLMLDEHGMICNCNPSCEALFGYPRNELLLQHVSMLLPQLDATTLMCNGQSNPRLRFLCRVGHPFEAISSDDEKFSCDLFLNIINWEGRDCLSLIVHPILRTPAS
jgi:PAS domain S-box-containing protein